MKKIIQVFSINSVLIRILNSSIDLQSGSNPESTKFVIVHIQSNPSPVQCSSLVSESQALRVRVVAVQGVGQCCSGSVFLESDPAELWDFLDPEPVGYHFCSSQNRIIQNVLKQFFCVLFFTAKILAITWEIWCWMMWFILFCKLSRMVDFHTAVARWRESDLLQSPLAMAIALLGM